MYRGNLHAKQKQEKQLNSSPENKISNGELFKTSLVYQTKEFFTNSTLHGVRYIAEQGRPTGEKLMWFCFTCIGGVAALIIIVSLWEKFQTNPTITGLDTDFRNQEVVFPTVAVCPNIPYNNESISNKAIFILDYDDTDDSVVVDMLTSLASISYRDNLKLFTEKFREFKENVSDNTYKTVLTNMNDVRKTVYDVQLSCEDVLKKCMYREEEIDCCSNFVPIFSENGLCYVFNSRYIEKADSQTLNENFRDLYETDKKWSFYIVPVSNSSAYMHSHTEVFGLDFSPLVQWDQSSSAEILISMKQTYTTEDAKQLSIGQRKCIFPGEVKLLHYTDGYRFSSCMKECRITKSYKLCKCIPPFYAPMRDYPQCKLDQLECIEYYLDNITDIRDCSRCELSCSNTVYDIEKFSKIIGLDPTKGQETHITIEFLTWPIIRYKREVLFGWVDLLVSFGGIAGLFLGFSLLSGVEIIYYFTMRACCMLYKNRDELEEIIIKKARQPQKYYDLDLKLRIRNRTTLPPDPIIVKGFNQVPSPHMKTKHVSTISLSQDISKLDHYQTRFVPPKTITRRPPIHGYKRDWFEQQNVYPTTNVYNSYGISNAYKKKNNFMSQYKDGKIQYLP